MNIHPVQYTSTQDPPSDHLLVIEPSNIGVNLSVLDMDGKTVIAYGRSAQELVDHLVCDL